MTTPFDDHELAELRRALGAMEARAPEAPDLDALAERARPSTKRDWPRRPVVVVAGAAALTLALLLPLGLWLRGGGGPSGTSSPVVTTTSSTTAAPTTSVTTVPPLEVACPPADVRFPASFLDGADLTPGELAATAPGQTLEAFFVGGAGASEGEEYLAAEGFSIVSPSLVLGYRDGVPRSYFTSPTAFDPADPAVSWGSCGLLRLVSGDLEAGNWLMQEQVDADATELPIGVFGGACVTQAGNDVLTEIVTVDVTEGDDTVEIVAWTRWRDFAVSETTTTCADIGLFLPVNVVLAAPLGDRILVNAGVVPAVAVSRCAGNWEPGGDDPCSPPILGGGLPAPELVDLVALFEATPVAVPVEVIHLPWGDEPGQVGTSADFGPCCFDILPDGSIVLMDGHNGRLQRYDGTAWRVLYEVGGDRPEFEDGIAALDSGVVAVATGDPEHGVMLLNPDGEVVAQGDTRRALNNGWWGGEDLWAVLGRVPFTRWARVTEGGALIPWGDEEEVDTFADGTLTFQMTYDRRGDLDPAYNVVTVTVGVDGVFGQWALHGGAVAGAAKFEPLNGGALGLWMADGDLLGVTMVPGAPLGVLRLPLNQWVQTGTFDFFRVHEGRLYLLQTYPDGARLEVYELP